MTHADPAEAIARLEERLDGALPDLDRLRRDVDELQRTANAGRGALATLKIGALVIGIVTGLVAAVAWIAEHVK